MLDPLGLCGARSSSKKPKNESSPIWINDVVDSVRTGDLLLTSNKDFGAKIIKTFTRTRWNHVGVVIKPSPNRAYLVEWGGGLFACELIERLQEYAEWDTVDVVIRNLKLPEEQRRSIEERMEKFIDMLFREKMGQNRGIPLGSIVAAARDQYSHSASEGKDEIVVDDLKQLFCSKTIAVTYKAAGILAPNRIADRFVPKHFSEEYDKYLALQGGASLSGEHRITFESRRLRDAVNNALNFPLVDRIANSLNMTANQEDKAARLVQKFVRRLAARREVRRRKAAKGAARRGSVNLYSGAEDVGTKDRMSLLKQQAAAPHKKPQDTLQLTWIDEDEAHEAGTPNGKPQKDLI